MPKKSGKKPVKIKRPDGKVVKIGKVEMESVLITKPDGSVDVIEKPKKKKGYKK